MPMEAPSFVRLSPDAAFNQEVLRRKLAEEPFPLSSIAMRSAPMPFRATTRKTAVQKDVALTG